MTGCIRHGLMIAAALSLAACSGPTPQSASVAPTGLNAASSDGLVQLNVYRVGTGSGSVVSNPSGIACPNDCVGQYEKDTVVALTATAGKNSVFAGWTDACQASGSNPVATVTMDVMKYCTATFNKTTGPAEPTGGPDLVARFSFFYERTSPNKTQCPGVLTTNQGDAAAGASTTRVLFSFDSVPDASDTLLWNVSVPSLLAGVVDRQIDDDPSTSAPFCIAAPALPGKYYYFVIADVGSAVAEINEGNNLRTYVMTVR